MSKGAIFITLHTFILELGRTTDETAHRQGGRASEGAARGGAHALGLTTLRQLRALIARSRPSLRRLGLGHTHNCKISTQDRTHANKPRNEHTTHTHTHPRRDVACCVCATLSAVQRSTHLPDARLLCSAIPLRFLYYKRVTRGRSLTPVHVVGRTARPVRLLAGVVGPTGLLGLCGSVRVRLKDRLQL